MTTWQEYEEADRAARARRDEAAEAAEAAFERGEIAHNETAAWATDYASLGLVYAVANAWRRTQTQRSA